MTDVTDDTPPEQVQTVMSLPDTASAVSGRTAWYVLTAGPSAGKTATMRELSARGFATAPEAARMVIDQAVSLGFDPATIRDEIDFQETVINYDQFIELGLTETELTFLDRSLADNIAYCRHHDRPVPDELIERCEGRYAGVFILEQLPFIDDYARPEDADEAEALHETIIETYEDLGYDPTIVPVHSVEMRANEILDDIGVHLPSPTVYTEEL